MTGKKETLQELEELLQRADRLKDSAGNYNLEWDAKSQLWPIIQGLESYRKGPGEPGHDSVKWSIYQQGKTMLDGEPNGPEAMKIREVFSGKFLSNDVRKNLYYIYLYSLLFPHNSKPTTLEELNFYISELENFKKVFTSNSWYRLSKEEMGRKEAAVCAFSYGNIYMKMAQMARDYSYIGDFIESSLKNLYETRDKIVNEYPSPLQSPKPKQQENSKQPESPKKTSDQPKKSPVPSKDDAPKTPEPEKVNQQKNTDFSQKPDNTEQEKVDKVKESGNLPAGEINDENQAKIEEIEKTLADKPEKLREAIQGKIENQLTVSGITEEELPSEAKTSFQQLKNNDITNPTKMREEGEKIIKEIGKLNANKTLTDLENQINEALTSKDEKKAKELKKKVSEFISSKNTYFQAEKSRAENLSKKLEDLVKSSSPSQNNPDFPWKVVVPASLFAVLAILGIVIVKRNKSKKLK